MSKPKCLTALADDFTTDAVHHPFTAFNQGYDACLAGYPIDRNPYTMRRERQSWRDGWNKAHDDGEEAIPR